MPRLRICIQVKSIGAEATTVALPAAPVTPNSDAPVSIENARLLVVLGSRSKRERKENISGESPLNIQSSSCPTPLQLGSTRGKQNVPILAENHAGDTVESGRVEARCAVPVVRVTTPSTACRASGRIPPSPAQVPGFRGPGPGRFALVCCVEAARFSWPGALAHRGR